MTIDEAIKHAREVAEIERKNISLPEYDIRKRRETECEKCAEEHEQLAVWLEELKTLREAPTIEKRATGRWIFRQRGKFVDMCCSVCYEVNQKEVAYNYPVEEVEKNLDREYFSNYCPHCGAKMEVEQK